MACFPELPPRAREVLEHLIRGLSEKEIAAAIGLSVHAVHRHVKEIYRRVEVNSRGELFAVIIAQLQRELASARQVDAATIMSGSSKEGRISRV